MPKMIITLILCLLITATPTMATGSETNANTHTGLVIQNTMYIPLRSVFQDFGYQVEWNNDRQAATIKNQLSAVTLTLNQKQANINGLMTTTAQAPVMRNGKVYIPLRLVSDALQMQTDWDQTTKIATVQSAGQTVRVLTQSDEKAKNYARTLSVGNRKISVRVVEIPLRAATPQMVVAKDVVGHTEELASMAKRSGAIAAINGTYFNAYGGEPLPYGNIIKDGVPLHRGSIGTTIGFYADGTAKMGHLELRSLKDNLTDHGWGEIKTAVGAGPRLLTEGAVTVDAVGEGYTEAKILNMRAARSAIGVKKDGTVLLCTTVADINELAAVMQQLGAHNAMNLDGGASSGLWFQGSYITPPGRLLSNALIFAE